MTNDNRTQQPVRPDAQKPFADTYIELFTLDTTTIPGEESILNFTSTSYTGSAIQFDGVTYTPIDIQTDGWETSMGGGFPNPTVTLSIPTVVDEQGSIAAIIKALIINVDGLVGATLTRTRTLKKFLDGESEADPNAFYPTDVYVINQMTKFTKLVVEWNLKAQLDQEGKRIPNRQIIRETCSHTYRNYDPTNDDADINGFVQGTCPYVQATYFERDGTPTGTAGDDQCGKRVGDCKLRFDVPADDGVLPFLGFPGVGKGRV